MIDVNKMPKLGFGLMRLPENCGKIDTQTVCKMVDMYLESGFNYFDTAYNWWLAAAIIFFVAVPFSIFSITSSVTKTESLKYSPP